MDNEKECVDAKSLLTQVVKDEDPAAESESWYTKLAKKYRWKISPPEDRDGWQYYRLYSNALVLEDIDHCAVACIADGHRHLAAAGDQVIYHQVWQQDPARTSPSFEDKRQVNIIAANGSRDNKGSLGGNVAARIADSIVRPYAPGVDPIP